MSTNECITDAAEQTRGHNLVQHPSFPTGSISLRNDARPTAWKIETDGYATFMAGDGSTYVGIVEPDESGKTQRIWQDLDLPVIAAAEGRPDYWLNCQYDATFFTQCTLKVYAVGDETRELFSAFLKGDASKYVPPKVKLPRGFVLPKSDPTWHTLTLGRIDVPEGVERVRVVFETPGKQPYRYLYLKNVLTQVRLPALDEASDLRLLVEREGAGPIVQATQPFLLCQGATHRLEVRTPAGNGWTGQPASLLWMDDDLLPGQQGLDAVPPFNIFDGDQQDRYQPILAEGGASWRLTVDAKREAGLPENGALGLGSYWLAPKHPIAASIGDFHYAIGDVVWNGVVPVIDAENSATLVATVKNPFTPARPVGNVAVVWQLNGSDYRTVPTDKNGHSKLEYTPRPGDEGSNNQAVFTATCRDALQQGSHSDCTLPVFATSPWPGELAVTLDGKPITDVSELALRLTRKSSHTLMLKPKRPDSYFIGKAIALNWPAGLSPQLGISFTPGAGVAQTMGAAGISWTIQGGSASGLFTVQAEEVAEGGLPVPFSLKGVQMSADLADEAQLSVTDAGGDSANIFRRGVGRTIRLVPKEGSPLAAAQLQGWLEFIKTDALDKEQVVASPAYDTKHTIGSYAAWTLTGANVSGRFGVQICVADLTPLKLDNALLLSLDLNDEAEMTCTASGKPAIFRRGQQETISFVPRRDSPLSASKLAYRLVFDAGGSLTDQQVVASPAYGKEFNSHNGPAWTLTGTNASGTFGVQIHMAGFSTPLKLGEAVLLSRDLNDEAELKFQGNVDGANPPIVHRGLKAEVSILPRPDSPLDVARLGVWLGFVPHGKLVAEDIPATPAYSETHPLLAGGNTWSLSGAQTKSGAFGLKVMVTGFDIPLTLDKGVLLSSSLSDEAQLQLTVPGQASNAPIIMRRNQVQTISMIPNSGSPLGETNLEGWSSTELSSKPAKMTRQRMTPEGMHWDMTAPAASGTVDLSIDMSGFVDNRLVLKDCLVLSEDPNDEFDLIVQESSVGGVGYFWRGAGQNVVLKPKESSPLKVGTTLRSELRFVDGASLPQEKLVASPTYGESHPIPAGGHAWTLTGATDASGSFGLAVWVDTFKTPVRLATGLLMSIDLADEVELKLSGDDVSAPPIVRRNQTRTFKLVPKAGSPILKAMDLKAQMSFNGGGTLKSTDIPATPGYGTPTTVDKGLEWTLAAKNISGVFGVTVKMEGFQQALVLEKCGVLAAKFKDELDGRVFPPRFIKRGEKKIGVQVRYPENSPLTTLGAELYLTAADIPDAITLIDPPVGTPNKVTASGATSWTMEASGAKSGSGRSNVTCSLFPGEVMPHDEIIVYSAFISDEVEMLWKGRVVKDWNDHGYFLVDKNGGQLSFRLKNIKSQGMGMKMRILNASDPFTLSPGLREFVSVSSSGWHITASTNGGGDSLGAEISLEHDRNVAIYTNAVILRGRIIS